jgi:hypothetical protein
MYGNGEDRSRVVLCRTTIHHLVHVGQEIRDNGPLLCYSQYYTERNIGLQTHEIHFLESLDFDFL